ncbi:MAG: 3-dehydroquinate synthase [Acidocella sp.]|nr:3-dehydroquinate synthase [Acidocella sp.]
MPISFEIKSQAGTYKVMSAPQILHRMADDMRTGVVIADDYFAPRLLDMKIPTIALPATEAAKSLDAMGEVIVQMRRRGATRDTKLWAIGGGVIQDITCFVATVYMRGLPWSYVPTTLLGMVDSCIGGKSSINVGPYKNILGSFHPPEAIWIDPDLVASLSAAQIVAGLVEAAKICYCRGADVFADYLSHNPDVGLSPTQFEPIMALSLGAKKWFIEVDEFDRAERQSLNLGHTFGHALESASGYRLSHGVAVGVGIICALAFSREPTDIALTGRMAALDRHMRQLLLYVPGLVTILREIDISAMLERVKSDKKHEPSYYRFVTTGPGGDVCLTRLPRDDVTETRVKSAVTMSLESLGV